MVRQSVIIVALLHKFVYEFRGNNSYIILDRTALTIIAKARPEHPSVQINLTAYICTCIGRRVVFTRERLDWTIESDGMSSFVPFRVK